MTHPLFDIGDSGPTDAIDVTDTAALRKARGAFFTPDPLCDYIADWAIRRVDDSILEPSCGEAAFLVAAARRLDRMGAAARPGQLHGVELHSASSRSADESLDGSIHKLSARAARGETVDDSDVTDLLVDLDDEADE